MGARNGFRWPTKPPPGSTLDLSHPLAKGLVAAWPCNEGAGGVRNAAPGGVGGDLAWSGPAAWAPSPDPRLGICPSVSGSSTLGGPAAAVSVSAPVSVAVWCSPRSAFTVASAFKLSDAATGLNRVNVMYGSGGFAGPFWLNSGDGGGGDSLTPAATSALGAWHLLVGVVDGPVLSFYQDGVKLTGTANHAPAGMNRVSVGDTFNSFSFGFGGAFVWDRALSDADAAALYAEGPGAVFSAPNARRFFAPAAGGGPTYYAVAAGGQQYVVQT